MNPGPQRTQPPANNLYTQLASYMQRHVNVQYRDLSGNPIEHTLRVKYMTNFGIAGRMKDGKHLFLPWTSVISVWRDPSA